MAVYGSEQGVSKEMLRIAERLRQLISRWARTTRDQAGTPSSAQMETLRMLHYDGPSSIAALAQRRLVKHQSMRLVIEQLAAEEMVLKRVNAKDRRSQIVSITAKGRALLRAEQRARALWIARSLQRGCSSEEVGQVVAAMDTLERLLDKAQGTPLKTVSDS